MLVRKRRETQKLWVLLPALPHFSCVILAHHFRKNLFAFSLSKGDTNIYPLFSSVAVINSLTYVKRFLNLWCSVYTWNTTLEFNGLFKYLWYYLGVGTHSHLLETEEEVKPPAPPLYLLSWTFWDSNLKYALMWLNSIEWMLNFANKYFFQWLIQVN